MAVVAAMALSACGGSGDGPRGFCQSITGGGAQLTNSCLGCTISNAADAADGSLGSSAVAVTAAGATTATATIRATAQNGIVYPAGSTAGVFYTPGRDEGCNNCGITVSTYMNGARQESQSGTNNSNVDGAPSAFFTGINTTLPFNAVEIVDTGAVSPTGGSLHLQVYEICSAGGVP